MASLVLAHSSSDVYILSMKTIPTLNSESQPCYALQCQVSYLAQEYTINCNHAVALSEQDLEDLKKISFSNISLYQ